MSNVYESKFDPRLYLNTYYASMEIPDDEDRNLRELTAALRERRFDRALEVGCGPTIHHAVPLAPRVAELHLSDYLPANLAEVRRWLDRDPAAHDWSAYIRGTLMIEGVAASDAAVAARAEELRAKVSALKVCDLHQDLSLGEAATYDLVTCFYTAECAARDRPEWERIMHRLARLVKPGGTLFQVSMRNCSRYMVGDRDIPATPVNEADFAAVLPACGFDPERTTITPVKIAAWADHGFDGVCVVRAEKAIQ